MKRYYLTDATSYKFTTILPLGWNHTPSAEEYSKYNSLKEQIMKEFPELISINIDSMEVGDDVSDERFKKIQLGVSRMIGKAYKEYMASI